MLFSFGELREIRCSEGLTVFIKKKFTITRVVKPYGIFQVKNALVKKKDSLACTLTYKGHSVRRTAYLGCTESELSD